MAACGDLSDPVALSMQLGIQTHPHEIQVHDDEPCWRQRLETAAFVFHCLGFGSEHLPLLERRVKDHEAECSCTRQAKAPAGLKLEGPTC